MIRNPLRLPQVLPTKKILSIDIGGTLAKAAFYMPKSELAELEKNDKIESITKEALPSKFDIHIF